MGIAVITAGFVLLLGTSPARASGDATGDLGHGGTVHGDISRTAGETDRITLDLQAGAALDLRLTATFQATLTLTDADAVPIDLGFTSGMRLHASIPITKSGIHTLAIASADGSQGSYAIVAKTQWARTVPVSGSGEQVIDVPVPAGAKIGCTVGAARGAAGVPQIRSLADPNGTELLQGAITATGRIARLRPTTASTGGTYRLAVAPDDGTSAWTGHVTRIVPRIPPTRLKLANGLDDISFRDDGVQAIFSRHCAPCHGFATSYQSVRSEARVALGKMASGAMPPGGGISRAEVALVRAWISTGMNP
jgi:mono/diheme cytochrome c family protein